jgi:PTS system mannose-specific IIA component
MSVGILLITHNGIGASLVEAATGMLGVCPVQIEALAVSPDADPDQLVAQAERRVEELDAGDGVLVLTDMFGSTPSNVATRLRAPGRLAVVAGVNLPMLVRVLNYASLGLPELVDKAASGGARGVLRCQSVVPNRAGRP